MFSVGVWYLFIIHDIVAQVITCFKQNTKFAFFILHFIFLLKNLIYRNQSFIKTCIVIKKIILKFLFIKTLFDV